jgi:hypothetical protein
VVDPSGAVATLWNSFGLPVLVIVITRHHWRHARRRNSLVVVKLLCQAFSRSLL